jgi:hypothetical protein
LTSPGSATVAENECHPRLAAVYRSSSGLSPARSRIACEAGAPPSRLMRSTAVAATVLWTVTVSGTVSPTWTAAGTWIAVIAALRRL